MEERSYHSKDLGYVDTIQLGGIIILGADWRYQDYICIPFFITIFAFSNEYSRVHGFLDHSTAVCDPFPGVPIASAGRVACHSPPRLIEATHPPPALP